MEECGSYMYVENYSMGGQEFTGCYNTVTHVLADTTQAICESYMWTPPVDIALTAMSTGIHNSLVAALSASNLVSTLQVMDHSQSSHLQIKHLLTQELI